MILKHQVLEENEFAVKIFEYVICPAIVQDEFSDQLTKEGNWDAISKSYEEMHDHLHLLRVPADDPRRQYLSTIFHFSNSCEFGKLSQFLHEHCTNDFEMHIKGKNPLFSFTENEVELPKTIVVAGIDPYVNLNALMAECVPDRVYRVTETIIRNRFDCMIIISKYSITGTLVLKAKLNQNSDFKTPELKVGNFQQDMVTGSRLVGGENSPHVSLESTATLVLDNTGKIRRLFFDYSSGRNEHWINIVNRKRKIRDI